MKNKQQKKNKPREETMLEPSIIFYACGYWHDLIACKKIASKSNVFLKIIRFDNYTTIEKRKRVINLQIEQLKVISFVLD